VRIPEVTLVQSEELPFDDEGEPNPRYGQCKAGDECVRDDPKEETRYFMMAGKALQRAYWGVYCEPCLEKAGRMARDQKKKKQEN
jgi:ribosomal protein L34E